MLFATELVAFLIWYTASEKHFSVTDLYARAMIDFLLLPYYCYLFNAVDNYVFSCCLGFCVIQLQILTGFYREL